MLLLTTDQRTDLRRLAGVAAAPGHRQVDCFHVLLSRQVDKVIVQDLVALAAGKSIHPMDDVVVLEVSVQVRRRGSAGLAREGGGGGGLGAVSCR